MANELSGLTGWKLLKAIRGRKETAHQNEGVATVTRRDADGTTYVRLPGSTFDTPVNGTSVVTAEMGDEVSYAIRDGRLSITGSTSNPAVGASQVQNSIHQVETTVENIRTAYIEADQVQAKELAAERARIGELEATALTAQSAIITDLQADAAKVHDLEADDLSAATAFVGDLSASNVTAQNVIADHAKVGQLDAAQIAADHATIATIDADYLKAADMQAEQARVNDLLADKANVSDLSAATARIGDLEADHVSVSDFEAEQANIDGLQAATADIATIRTDAAKVHNLNADQLSAATAYIAALNADNITAASLSADVGKIHNLTANEISAAAAYIAALNADSVTAQNIIAMNGDFATVKANAAKVANLTAAQIEADHATVGSLDANYAQINMANVNNAWITNGAIKNGAISDAMINSVSANKLTAGTIDASNITVTNLNADNITTGTINGQRIGEGSLSLSKLEEDVYTETEVDTIVNNLQTQIDGAIETWTGTDVPTLSNSPASAWTTNAIKDTHVGDVYFVVNSSSQQNGYNYRFTKSGNAYSWQLIKDSDVTNALQRLTTAEGKITTFDSDISQLKTDTGTLTTKTTSLETRMSDAEADILDKVDTTTFNEVSDTVDSHSQSITQMSTTLSNKADSSTVSAVTQRVSKNEQDISGINTTIGELQTTVESKADGSTVETMSTKLNTVSDTVDGHTQSISSINSTLSNKADSSTVSTLTTKVNNVSDTVDGHTQSLQSITQTQTTIQGSAVKSTVQLWFTKANTTAPAKPTAHVTTNNAATGNAWNLAVPTYNASYPNYYYCYEYEYLNGTYGWSAVTRDIATGEMQERARTAITNAANAQADIDGLEIGGRNLLLQSDYQSSLTRNGITFTNNSNGSVTANGTATALAAYCFALSKTFDAGTYTLSGCPPTGSDSAYRLDLLSVPVSSGNAAVADYGDGVTFKTIGGTTGECRFRVASGATVSNITIYPKLEKGNRATDWTPAPEDVDADISTAQTSADNAQATANKNVKESQQLWFTKANGSAPAKPTAKVTLTSTSGNAWTTTVPTYSASYPYYFYCMQYIAADGTVTWSDVVYDQATTEAQSVARAASADLTEFHQEYATFKQTVSAFESTVGETYATKTELQTTDDKIDNLEIGGRNLLRNTNWTTESIAEFITSNSTINKLGGAVGIWSRESPAVISIDSDGLASFTITGSTRYGIYQDVILDPGTYTLSALTGANFHANISSAQWPSTNTLNQLPNGRNAITFDVATKATYRVYINCANGNTIAGNYPKLEKGNKATDWTPAPEDVDAAIDKVDSKTSVRLHLRRDNWSDANWGAYASVGHSDNFQNIHVASGGATSATGFDATTLNIGDLIVIEGISTGTNIPYSATAKVTSIPSSATGDIPATVISANNAKAIEARVASAETSITQTNNQIALKANASDVYTKTQTDGLISTEVSNRNSAIEQSANAINLSVSQTYTTKTEFNALEVGGRNLLTNAQANWKTGNLANGIYASSGYQICPTNGSQGTNFKIPIEPNTPYIVQGWSELTDYPILFVGVHQLDENLTFLNDSSWRQITGTGYSFTSLSNAAYVRVTFRTQPYSAEGSNAVVSAMGDSVRIKLEKGNKPTDWTPAPEDIESRVEAAEASIAINADNIESKVSKDGVISSINQSAESVTINANRVNIEGATIFSSGRLSETSLNNTYDPKGAAQEAVSGAFDNRVNDSAEFLYRLTADGEDVPSGRATIQTIKGNTLRWNQLAPSPFGELNTLNGVTFAKSGDGMTMNGTATNTVYKPIKNNVKTVIGHTYFVRITGTGLTNVTVYNDGGGVTVYATDGSGIGVATSEKLWYIRIANGTEIDGFIVVSIFDLTAMFGAGNEPATVAEFEALYPLPYYAYDPGSLLPVRMEGIETVGFNRWDEETEPGYISQAGSYVSAEGNWLTKNFIAVFPNTSYYFKAASPARFVFYDAVKNYLRWGSVQQANTSLTIPADVHFIKFFRGESAYTKGDICINISDPSRNGTYEPHWSSERTIPAATYFPQGMRSAGTVRDELTNTEAVQRVGEVTFDGSSDESWGIATIGSGYRFSSKLTNAIESNTPNRVFAECNRLDLLLSGGTGVEGANGFNISSAGYFIVALNTLAPSVTTVEQLRAWLAQNPLTLHYALATPTTTTFDPPLNFVYKADVSGTERIIVDETKDAPQSSPVPMDITYGVNLYEDTIDDVLNISSRVSATEEAISPLASKTYTGIIGTANDANGASFYFGNVFPVVYDGIWKVHLRINVTEPVLYQQSIDIMISGHKSSYMSFDSVVARSSSALAVYFINLYRATQTGIGAGIGHALGFGLRASTNPTNASYKRTISVDVLDVDNCSVKLFDTAVTYDNLPSYNTTNYGVHSTSGSLTELGVATNGQNASNNGNTYDRTYHNNPIKAATAITAGHIICGTSAGYKNIAAGTTFDISYPILYSPNAIAANSTRSDTYSLIPSINFSNNGTIQSGVAYAQLYLKGTIVGNTFTIAASPFMTTVVPTTEDGYFYIPMGIMSSATAGYFESSTAIYAFLDGKFRQVTPTEIVASHRIYYRTGTVNNSLAAPTTWVAEATGDTYNAWTTKVPPLSSGVSSTTKYPYLYTCEQRKRLDGTVECTKVLLDDSNTIIDGGTIITGSIAANKLDVYDATIGKISTSAINLTGYAQTNDIPTKVSDLTNDSGFQDSSQVETAITSKGYATQNSLNSEINQRKANYGTSSTAAATQAKAVTCSNFELVAGNELTVKFSTANTYASGAVQLNVNSKGAKNVWVGNAVTSASNQLLWGANAYITFRYDGTQFIVIGEPRTWYGASTTAEGTAAKTDTTAVTGCVICKGAKVELAMTNANTATAPTLNIQSTGAKNIYFGNGTATPTKADGTSWLATNTCTFTFDGQYWRTAGKTYIDANSIVTGYLSADRIEAGSLSAGVISATSGTFNVANIPSLSSDKITVGGSTLTSNLSAKDSAIADAAKHTQVIISATNVNYVANTCTLTARLYIDGVLQTSTSLKWQWYRDGTTQGSQTTGATGSLAVTSSLGLAHRYACKCTF